MVGYVPITKTFATTIEGLLRRSVGSEFVKVVSLVGWLVGYLVLRRIKTFQVI